MITLIIIGILLWIINRSVYNSVHTIIMQCMMEDWKVNCYNAFHFVLYILSAGCIGVGIYKFFVK